MLRQQFRFHSRGALGYLYRNAATYRSHPITLRTLTTNKTYPRFAVIVSKKVFKPAYGRNRMRRRVYEILRHEQPNLVLNQDSAFIITTSEVMTMPHTELRETILQLLHQANLYKSAPTPGIIVEESVEK